MVILQRRLQLASSFIFAGKGPWGRINRSTLMQDIKMRPLLLRRLHSVSIFYLSLISISAGTDWRDQHFYGVCTTFHTEDPLSTLTAMTLSIAHWCNWNNRWAQAFYFQDMQTPLCQSMERESPIQMRIASPSPSGGQRKFVFPKAAAEQVSANRRFSLHDVSN